LTEDVRQSMDALGINKAILVGHSMAMSSYGKRYDGSDFLFCKDPDGNLVEITKH
jgi:hypothetical protein